jgi:hypothetical protein
MSFFNFERYDFTWDETPDSLAFERTRVTSNTPSAENRAIRIKDFVCDFILKHPGIQETSNKVKQLQAFTEACKGHLKRHQKNLKDITLAEKLLNQPLDQSILEILEGKLQDPKIKNKELSSCLKQIACLPDSRKKLELLTRAVELAVGRDLKLLDEMMKSNFSEKTARERSRITTSTVLCSNV